MMREMKIKLPTILIMLGVFFVGILCLGKEVEAAFVGEMESEGNVDGTSITFRLDENGNLVFSGTQNEHGNNPMLKVSNWDEFWWNIRGVDQVNHLGFTGLDKTKVTSITVEGNVKIDCYGSLAGMFKGFTNCKTVDLSKFDLGNVTSTQNMFNGCTSLESVTLNTNTSQLINVANMFNGCTSLKSFDWSCDMSQVYQMIGMFEGCESLESVTLPSNTPSLLTMADMFNYCKSLTSLIWSPDTSKVSNMSGLFNGCKSLSYLDLRGFDTSEVSDMTFMFQGCTSLQSVVWGDFEADKLERMQSMYAACSALTTVQWNVQDTSRLTNMNAIFAHCTSLVTVDMSAFETQNVVNMSLMFYQCPSLTTVDVSNFNTSNVTTMSVMFNGCESLSYLDLSGFDTRKATDVGAMFSGCHSLKKLDISSFANADIGILLCDNLEEFVSANTTASYKIGSDGDYWYDQNQNVYSDGDDWENVAAKTTFYRAKPTYNIRYVYKGTLIDCPLSYNPRWGVRSLGTVELDHYTFGGWYANEMSNTPVTSIPAGTLFDQTLYARMIPDTYNITYHNTELATNVETLFTTYTYSWARALPELTNDCYVFDGWYLDEELTQKLEGITDTTNGDLVLYAKWTLSHEYVLKDMKEATCTSKGYTGDLYCTDCQKVIENGTETAMLEHEIDKSKGTIVTPSTPSTEGKIQYSCKNCDYTVTEAIPKVEVDDSKEQGNVNETTEVTDESILDTKDDNDIAGSSFAMIQARADKTTKNSIRLKWNKVKNADGYKIYGNKCGKKNRYKYIKTISNGKTTKFTQKKLKKGTYYKYIVRAYKLIDGQEVTIAASKTIHATTTGGKYGNAKSVKIKTDKKMESKKGSYTLTIKKNKKYTIKASEVKQSKKIKKHRVIKFESSDASVATVNSKGAVKGIKKGTCYIYAYAQNGAYKKIKVKVK